MTNPRSSGFSTLAPRLARVLGVAAVALSAVACGDFGGEAQGTTSGPSGSVFDPSAIPGGQAAFEATVYPLVTQYCTECHAGAGPGSPHFANPMPNTAYTEILRQNKVDLANPDQSRIVRKVVDELHHCWSDCPADGATLQAAVAAWADMVDFDQGGVSVGESLASQPLMLSDGTEDSSAERYDDNVIAKWDFKENAGGVAFDSSGVTPSIDLALQGNVTWLSAWGIQIEPGGTARAMANSRKLFDRIAAQKTGSGQYSVEAWITNAKTTLEGPAAIIEYSSNAGSHNFGLGQVLYTYDYRNRSVSPNIGGNGTPALVTYDADQDLQDRLQHVVITYDLFRGRRVYVDGRWTEDVDPQLPGRLFNWNANHVFTLGNEPSGDRQWEGQVRFAAIFDHALTEAQIKQNFDAGVGKRLSMSFDVSRWAGPGSAIEFQVSEFDNGSYMFCQPTFRTPTPAGFRLAHVRIAVNGVIAPTGQGFVTMDTPITQNRQQLSARCAVIPKGTGPTTDQFNIVFEHLGGFQNVIDEPMPPPAVVMLDPSARPNNGVRDYARLRESFARLTGVNPLLPAIEATFNELEQQLPSGYDVRSFVSSNQVGIAKLALEFCDALVESNPLRTSFFGDFPFTSNTSVFADVNRRNQVADALYDKMLGTGLSLQPARTDTRGDLSTMVDSLLTSCAAPCDQVRTRSIVKGECAAVLASAAVSMH